MPNDWPATGPAPGRSHRESYPEQYEHSMCGKHVRVRGQSPPLTGVIERVVGSRFGPMAYFFGDASAGVWRLEDCEEIGVAEGASVPVKKKERRRPRPRYHVWAEHFKITPKPRDEAAGHHAQSPEYDELVAMIVDRSVAIQFGTDMKMKHGETTTHAIRYKVTDSKTRGELHGQLVIYVAG